MSTATNQAGDDMERIRRALARVGWVLVRADDAYWGWWAQGPQGQLLAGLDALDLVERVQEERVN